MLSQITKQLIVEAAEKNKCCVCGSAAIFCRRSGSRRTSQRNWYCYDHLPKRGRIKELESTVNLVEHTVHLKRTHKLYTRRDHF